MPGDRRPVSIAGEQWTVGDLLIAMMVRSGNDAALTLAPCRRRLGRRLRRDDERQGQGTRHDQHVLREPRRARCRGHYSSAPDLLTLIIAASQEYPDIQRLGRIKLPVNMPPDPNGKERVVQRTRTSSSVVPRQRRPEDRRHAMGRQGAPRRHRAGRSNDLLRRHALGRPLRRHGRTRRMGLQHLLDPGSHGCARSTARSRGRGDDRPRPST